MILYLPGFSLKNENEQSAVSNSLTASGYEVLNHKWRHWGDEKVRFDVEAEMDLICSSIQGKTVEALIAKSIGSYVTSRLIWSRMLNAPKIIFLGVPLNDLDQEEKEIMQLAMRRIVDRLTLIHNSKDPHGSVDDLNRLTRDITDRIILKESMNHEYNYPNEIISILRG